MLSLCISGFEADPDEVTLILGITPTSVGRMGEPNKSGRARTFNGWWLETHETRLTDGAAHDSALNAIVALLRGKADRFNRLRQALKPTQISIYGGLHHLPEQQCGVWLDPGQMQVLAECGLGWGLDVFVEPAERRCAP
jgi:hypothetical protein